MGVLQLLDQHHSKVFCFQSDLLCSDNFYLKHSDLIVEGDVDPHGNENVAFLHLRSEIRLLIGPVRLTRLAQQLKRQKAASAALMLYWMKNNTASSCLLSVFKACRHLMYGLLPHACLFLTRAFWCGREMDIETANMNISSNKKVLEELLQRVLPAAKASNRHLEVRILGLALSILNACRIKDEVSVIVLDTVCQVQGHIRTLDEQWGSIVSFDHDVKWLETLEPDCESFYDSG